VFALIIRASIFLFHLPSLVNSTLRHLNFSTCCSVHWLKLLERYNTLVFLVLIFIQALSHAAANQSNGCWRPCSQDASSNKSSKKGNASFCSFQQWHPHPLDCDNHSNSYKLWRGAVSAHHCWSPCAYQAAIAMLQCYSSFVLMQLWDKWTKNLSEKSFQLVTIPYNLPTWNGSQV